jgi:hypothetical protein
LAVFSACSKKETKAAMLAALQKASPQASTSLTGLVPGSVSGTGREPT